MSFHGNFVSLYPAQRALGAASLITMEGLSWPIPCKTPALSITAGASIFERVCSREEGCEKHRDTGLKRETGGGGAKRMESGGGERRRRRRPEGDTSHTTHTRDDALGGDGTKKRLIWWRQTR